MRKDVTISQELNEIPTHNQLVKVSEVLAGFFSRAQADWKKKKKKKAEKKLQMMCRPRTDRVGKYQSQNFCQKD